MTGAECPLCGNNQVVSTETAREVYVRTGWDIPDNARYTCGFCHAVSIGGNWRRVDTIKERAWELKHGDSRERPVGHYIEKLTD